MKKIISFLGIIFFLTGCSSDFKTVDSNEVKTYIENGATIIDVRTEEEYNDGHIKDAINIPVENMENISLDKNTVIIVYCASGVRSETAANKLINMGYSTVYNLDGGLINWGFELED